jgi:hypothetical protein
MFIINKKTIAECKRLYKQLCLTRKLFVYLKEEEIEGERRMRKKTTIDQSVIRRDVLRIERNDD